MTLSDDTTAVEEGCRKHPKHGGVYRGYNPKIRREPTAASGLAMLLHRMHGRPSEIGWFGVACHERTPLVMRRSSKFSRTGVLWLYIGPITTLPRG